MSPLWSGKNTKLSTNQRKPSPTYQHTIPGSARNRGIHRSDKFIGLSIKWRSIEGSSLLISLKRKISAGMTVEAAVVMPLFLFFFLNLGSAMEMMRLHGKMQLALWDIGNELTMYAYAVNNGKMDEEELQAEESGWWNELAGIAFASSYIKSRLVEALGEKYIESSPVADGVSGLLLWESDIAGENGEVELVVTYGVEPVWGLAEFGTFRMANHYYAHDWSGYEIPEVMQTVYVTENGEVYHLDRNCSYLKIVVLEVSREVLGELRNQNGAGYIPCKKCVYGSVPIMLYVTETGDCYHFAKDCAGLKRTVRAIQLEQAAGYRACSRCGGT